MALGGSEPFLGAGATAGRHQGFKLDPESLSDS
jgi:hypothetical protein